MSRGLEYFIYYTLGAMKDDEGRAVLAADVGSMPYFTAMDTNLVRPTPLPNGLRPSGQAHGRRLSVKMSFALAPKPEPLAARGSTLRMSFDEAVEPGSGELIIVDCSPGNASRCHGDGDDVPDEEVMILDVSSAEGKERLKVEGDGSSMLLVTKNLQPGRLHAIRTYVQGVITDKAKNQLLPIVDGWWFWVQPDDARIPEVFLKLPVNGSDAPPDTNITLFFGENIQPAAEGYISLSDGEIMENISLETSPQANGKGYAIIRDSMVIINPSVDFTQGKMVTLYMEEGTFSDFAGNPFPGFAAGEYVFRISPPEFEMVLEYERYLKFREPRFQPREGALLQFTNHTFLLYGGRRGEECYADSWISKTGDEWIQLKGVKSLNHDDKVPMIANAPSAVDYRGCVWIIGGDCNNDPGRFWITCDVGRSWDPIERPIVIPFGPEVPPKLPEFFYGHAIAIIGGWQMIIVDAAPNTSHAVWRWISIEAERVQRVAGEKFGPLPFGERSDPKLLATANGGLYLVGGHLCFARSLCDQVFNDVWFSPDGGESWQCKTTSFAAGWPLRPAWNGIGRYSAVALTQDDTIYIMGGHKLGSNGVNATGTNVVLSSFGGQGDIKLSDRRPYVVRPGSVLAGLKPALPHDRFAVYFGELIMLNLSEGVVLFYEQIPEEDNRTFTTTGTTIFTRTSTSSTYTDTSTASSTSSTTSSTSTITSSTSTITTSTSTRTSTTITSTSYTTVSLTTPWPPFPVPPGAIPARATVNGTVLLLKPKRNLESGRNYVIDIPAGFVQDIAGNKFNHITGEDMEVSISTDVEPPYLVDMWPANESDSNQPWSHICFYMSEPVTLGTGSLKLTAPQGETVEIPMEDATVLNDQVIFRMAPSQRLTYGQEYTVSYPAGMFVDSASLESLGGEAGSFTVMSGPLTLRDYKDNGMPDPPTYTPSSEEEELEFPKYLGSWPQRGATDVPAELDIAVWFYFSAPVTWSSVGYASLFNDTHTMREIATSNYSHVPNASNEYFSVYPELNAVKMVVPHNGSGALLLQPGYRYGISLSEGALQDSNGNLSMPMGTYFDCLAMAQDFSSPTLVASTVADGDVEVKGSLHKFDFYFNEDIQLRTKIPPVILTAPTGKTYRILENSPDLRVDKNKLSVTFEQHVMKDGGQWMLNVDRYIYQDMKRLTRGVDEGGLNAGSRTIIQTFLVAPEDVERAHLNLTFCYPPSEETYDDFAYEFPHTGSILLGFNKDVFVGEGMIHIIPRSFGVPTIIIPATSTRINGQLVIVSPPVPSLLPGEVYDLILDENAFYDFDGYMLEEIEERYIFSTQPLLRFQKVGSEHWEDTNSEAPGQRLAPAAAVDAANRIFLIGGRSSTLSLLQGDAMNDVWMLRTDREVSCASSFEGEVGCSYENCKPDENGVFTLGTETQRRFVYQKRSVAGVDCFNVEGQRRSQMLAEIDSRTNECPCPTCTSYPGPPDGPDLPLYMPNTEYIQEYVLVPSADTRPLLCVTGRTPTGNFSCNLYDRYFAIYDTPYPTCENSTCPVPPDFENLDRFAVLDLNGSTDGRNCSSNLSHDDPMPHGGICAIKCEPGWKADNVYRCDQGKFRVPQCWRQVCPNPPLLQNGRLDCSEFGGPFQGAECELVCEPGFGLSHLTTTCGTDSDEPEAQPFFTPSVYCSESICGDYKYTEGATIEYDSDSRAIHTASARITCTDGYEVAGSALGLPDPIELWCGPMYEEENSPLVEWKLGYNGARAGLICAPYGMAVYPKVGLTGTIILTLTPPADITIDEFCGPQYEEKFYQDVSISIVMALSSAGGLVLETEAVTGILVGACGDVVAYDNNSIIREEDDGDGTGARRLSAESAIAYSVKVADDAEATLFQKAINNPEARTAFARVFSLALLSQTGIVVTDVMLSDLAKDVLYELKPPDGTQTAIVLNTSSNNSGNDTEDFSGDDELPFTSSPAFFGIVAGAGVCCCGCIGALFWRRYYGTKVDPDGEDPEEESDFEEDPEIEDVVVHA